MAVKKTQMYRRNLDGTETRLNPLTESQYVLMENGQTVQEVLSDRDSDKYTPVITNSSSTFKVGQGDNVDLSSSMKEGAYDSCVLKGKTLVNCIQEPSSQDVVLPYAFEDGQYVTINDTKESGALGVELKGQTLVNIHKRQEYKLGRSTETIASNKFENIVAEENRISFDIVDNLTYGWGSFVNGGELDLDILKPNTKYLVYFGTASFPDYFGVSFRNGDSTSLICTQAQVNKGANYAIVTTTNEIIKNKQIIYISIPQQCVGHYEFKDIKIIEYQQGMENWDFPYFEGMTSCQMPTLKTCGKNLFDGKLEDGSLNGNTGDVATDGFYRRTVNFIRIDSNKEYRLRVNGTVNGRVYFYDANKTYISNKLNESRLTVPSNAKYLKFRIGTDVLSNGQEIQLEESSSATAYETHKSSILSLPEEVVLRSLPNGVKDTLNLNTGEYVKRIGERVFYGTEKGWKYRNLSNNGEIAVFSANTGDGVGIEDWKIVRDAQNETVACDSFLTHQERSGIANISALNKECLAYFLDSYGVKFIYIAINKNKASDLAKLKSYLASNPITVQYQLETPIVTKINLPSILKSWNTTTHIYSEIPENTLYPILSHSNPIYPVILKPSTKYSIVANSYSNSHTNPAINFNLGGATASTTVGNRVTTITTPSTLTSEELVMSGRGNKLNNVMVIEGDVVGDEPYFEGICDCKSPILSNIGKNLVDSSKIRKWMDKDTHFEYPDYIRVEPNTWYITNLEMGCWDYYNINKEHIGQKYTNLAYPNIPSYLTPNDCYYLKMRCWGGNTDTSKGLEYYQKYFALYEGMSNQPHEPHKSNTTTFEQKDGKTIVLRSLPSGVCDTLNVETGEYVQRIGEVVLDGSRGVPSQELNGYFISYYGLDDVKKENGGNVYCDKFASHGQIWAGGREGVSTFSNGTIWLSISIDKLKTPNIDGMKAWLSQNPVTVQYELTTPIISTIDVQGFPYAYTNGHVQLSSGRSGQSLTPKVEYSLSANKTGQINSNTKRVSAHQKQLDDFEAMMLTSMVQSAYDKAILQFDYEMRMMSLGGE